jgi:hypothetical protein
MTFLASDNNGHDVQAVALGLNQAVSFTSSGSAATAAVGVATRIVRLVATVDCHVAFGADPTATTSSMLLPAGSVEYVAITPGHKVAARGASASGTLHVTEAA